MNSNGVYIFLDIDGVLNNTNVNNFSLSRVYHNNMAAFNRLLELLKDHFNYRYTSIVISSAWRYMMKRQNITLEGFENMLKSHGMNGSFKVVGRTCWDEEIPLREMQITNYLHKQTPLGRLWIVLDDMDLKFNTYQMKETGGHYFRINAETGLTIHKVDEIYGSISLPRRPTDYDFNDWISDRINLQKQFVPQKPFIIIPSRAHNGDLLGHMAPNQGSDFQHIILRGDYDRISQLPIKDSDGLLQGGPSGDPN